MCRLNPDESPPISVGFFKSVIMCYREKKYQPTVIYNGNHVKVLEENEDEYFIYLKNVCCGYVPKEKCELVKEDK